MAHTTLEAKNESDLALSIVRYPNGIQARFMDEPREQVDTAARTITAADQAVLLVFTQPACRIILPTTVGDGQVYRLLFLPIKTIGRTPEVEREDGGEEILRGEKPSDADNQIQTASGADLIRWRGGTFSRLTSDDEAQIVITNRATGSNRWSVLSADSSWVGSN